MVSRLPDFFGYSFFVFVGCVCSQLAYAQCAYLEADREHEIVKVIEVIDGDTVVLAGNSRVRIIGINTPEKMRKANNRYGAAPAHPYADEAREHLQFIIGKEDISLVFDEERLDRHKRLLAHPFNSEGVNITEAMLEAGLGFAITFPPNLLYSKCYFEAEDRAREADIGVWSDNFFAPIQASELEHTKRDGFMFVDGVVDKLEATRQGAWINFKSDFTLLIKYKNVSQFTDISTWPERTARVRGWLIDRGKYTKPWHKRWMMVLSYPSMIDFTVGKSQVK